jgi:hypothetical protein
MIESTVMRVKKAEMIRVLLPSSDTNGIRD